MTVGHWILIGAGIALLCGAGIAVIQGRNCGTEDDDPEGL